MSKRLKPTNPKRDEGGPVQRAETNDRAMAGPSALDDDGMARGPVKSPEHQHHRGDDDLGRRM
jgi:hypothetical protein